MTAGNTARLYRVEALIRARGHVTFAELQQELGVSRATLKRDLEFLRSRMGAPIEYDALLGGYRFGAGYAGFKRHELPGLWFDESELYSLLTAQQLLAGVDPGGLLSRHLQPLLDRIAHLLASGQGDDAAARITQRVKIVGAQRRPVAGRFFERVTAALLRRRQLHLRYFTRGRGTRSEREVSPQRLVHYRNTWYLDAWCHRADALRRFALDAVEEAQLLDTPALEMALAEVEAAMDAGYGVYAGGEQRWARLRFQPQAAQWASREEWHPQQQGQWQGDGCYEMRLPYVDATELVMDVLRQGDEVEVLEPPDLVDAVRARLAAALRRYAASPSPSPGGSDERASAATRPGRPGAGNQRRRASSPAAAPSTTPTTVAATAPVPVPVLAPASATADGTAPKAAPASADGTAPKAAPASADGTAPKAAPASADRAAKKAAAAAKRDAAG